MTYSVRTPILFWFGSAALIVTFLVVLAAWGNWLAVFCFGAIFGGCGATLLLMSAEVSGDPEHLRVKRIHSDAQVRWIDIERVAEGGGNVVFYSKSGRITAPSFEFWVGADKAHLLALLRQKLEEERHVPFQENSLRARFHIGNR